MTYRVDFKRSNENHNIKNENTEADTYSFEFNALPRSEDNIIKSYDKIFIFLPSVISILNRLIEWKLRCPNMRNINLLATDFFFQILAHSVLKM